MRILLAVSLAAVLVAAAPYDIPQHANAEEAMPSDIWINLPVKDVARARDFFTRIGFALNPDFANGDNGLSLLVGKKQVVVMLWPEETFSEFASHEVSDTRAGSQVLFSIGVDSREAVDEMAEKAAAAGGTVFGEPAEMQGWMYGAAFADPDGHRWNVLYMDMSRMPQQ